VNPTTSNGDMTAKLIAKIENFIIAYTACRLWKVRSVAKLLRWAEKCIDTQISFCQRSFVIEV
jgi:hypothetical protein